MPAVRNVDERACATDHAYHSKGSCEVYGKLIRLN